MLPRRAITLFSFNNGVEDIGNQILDYSSPPHPPPSHIGSMVCLSFPPAPSCHAVFQPPPFHQTKMTKPCCQTSSLCFHKQSREVAPVLPQYNTPPSIRYQPPRLPGKVKRIGQFIQNRRQMQRQTDWKYLAIRNPFCIYKEGKSPLRDRGLPVTLTNHCASLSHLAFSSSLLVHCLLFPACP